MHLFLQAQTEGGIAGFLPLIAILGLSKCCSSKS